MDTCKLSCPCCNLASVHVFILGSLKILELQLIIIHNQEKD